MPTIKTPKEAAKRYDAKILSISHSTYSSKNFFSHKSVADAFQPASFAPRNQSSAMTKTTNVNPKGMGIDDLKPHVRRGLEFLRKGEYVASYGLKDSEELIKSSEETDALPERGDKDHPFSKFLVAVATEISQELGIAKGKKKKFVKDMEDKLFTTSKDWVGLIREKSQPESNSTAASITDDAEEANVSKEKDEAGGKKDETKSSKNDKAGGKKNETKSSKNDKAGAKKGETKSSKKDEAGAKKNQTKSSKMEAKKKPTTTPKKPNSKSLSDDTNEREKDQTEAKKVQKKRGKQEDDVIETASSKKLKTKATPADKKDNGEDDSEVLLQSKVEFEAERDATLERLPSDVKDLFGQVCLAKWGKETLPALVLNPYSVAPGPVRDEWLEHFKVSPSL